MAKKDKDKKSGGFGGFTSVRDMFDGGGAGRSGDTFQGGGIISSIGNAANIAPRGYHDNNSGGGNSSSAQRSAPQRRISNRGVLDFFDGGGIGARGSSFQGLPISTLFNTMGVRPQGSQVANPRQQAGLYDFVDGGGYGRSGQDFRGLGTYSMLANALGVKPMGYEDRLGDTRPQMRQVSAGTGFGDDYSDMLTSEMGLGQNPYEITPEDARPLTSMSTPSEIDDFYNSRTNTIEFGDPLGAGVIVDDGGFDNYVAGLGGAAEGMTPEALRYAYRLHQQGYTN